jgi:hypothetical protein
MVSLLVRDMLRRLPTWQLALTAAVFAIAWGVCLAQGRSYAVMAGSLTIAFYFGPIVMHRWLEPSPVSYLPVSRRDIWRAAWTMSVVAPLVMITAVKIPGAMFAPGGWSTLTLSSTMDLLYAGTGSALLAAARRRGNSASLLLLAFAGMLSGLILPFLLRHQLPTRWSAVSAFTVALFTAGAAATIYSVVHVPPATTRPLRRPDTSGPSVVTTPIPPTRISGLARLLFHELAFVALLASLMIGVVLGVALAIGDQPAGGWRAWLETQGLLIFHAAARGGTPRRWDVINQVVWCALYVGTVSVRFPDFVKHLRTLPIDAVRLQVLFLGWPILTWSVVWIALALLHVLAVGGPATAGYRLALLFALSGLSALAIALHLRFRTVPIGLVNGAAFLIPFAKLGDAPVWVACVVGALATTVAIAVNRSALSRADTYKRASPFGLRTERI